MSTTALRVAVFAAASLAFAGAAQAEGERVVNVYNWSDYVAKDTLEKFTQETGIKVNYDVYDDNAILESKLMAGKSGYDVVFPSATPFFAQQIRGNVYAKLDMAKIPNAAKLDPAVMATLAKVDPGNQYGLPYMMAATALAFNVDKLKKVMPDAPVDSWSLVFDPAVLAKIKGCGVSLLDTPTEVIPVMLNYMGRDPMSQDKADLDAAMTALQPLRLSYKYLHNSKYINDLANGDTCVAHGYGGDLIQARERAKEAKRKQNIQVFIPKEGAEVNIDVMAIPADAPHPDAAHAFINFILRPDIIAAITGETGYANAVPAAAQFTDPAIQNDPVIFPPAAVRAKLFTPPPPATRDYERLRTRAWAKFRAVK